MRIPVPARQKGAVLAMPEHNDCLRFLLPQRIFLTRNSWLPSAVSAVTSEEQT
jgi:hypothetical protein